MINKKIKFLLEFFSFVSSDSYFENQPRKHTHTHKTSNFQSVYFTLITETHTTLVLVRILVLVQILVLVPVVQLYLYLVTWLQSISDYP